MIQNTSQICQRFNIKKTILKLRNDLNESSVDKSPFYMIGLQKYLVSN